jgi:ribonucleoside-diphosphate reductase alpha chain
MLCGRTHTILRAGTLFDSVTRAAYDFAERGVFFIDRINARNNLADWETIPLDRRVPAARSAAAALRAPLGSINRRGRSAPLTSQASLDEVELADLLAVAIRSMENTIEASGSPPEAQHSGWDDRPMLRGKHRTGQRTGSAKPAGRLT